MLGSFIYLRLRAISLRYYRQFGVIECMIEERWRRRPRTRLRNCTILRSLAKNRQPGSRGLASCSLSAFHWSADRRRSPILSVFWLLKIPSTRIPIWLSYQCHKVIRRNTREIVRDDLYFRKSAIASLFCLIERSAFKLAY